MEEQNKNIDESWKETIRQEKHDKHTEDESPQIPEATFSFFVTTLGIQVAIALGEIPNPVTNKTEESLDQAKYLIDILDMLKEKTKNNLNQEETQLLENLLYDFHTKFVAKKERMNL